MHVNIITLGGYMWVFCGHILYTSLQRIVKIHVGRYGRNLSDFTFQGLALNPCFFITNSRKYTLKDSHLSNFNRNNIFKFQYAFCISKIKIFMQGQNFCMLFKQKSYFKFLFDQASFICGSVRCQAVKYACW